MTVNYDELWYPEREETIDELNKRITKTFEFIKYRSEQNIAFVNHNSFIEKMKDNHISYIENGEKEFKHCSPYLIEL